VGLAVEPPLMLAQQMQVVQALLVKVLLEVVMVDLPLLRMELAEEVEQARRRQLLQQQRQLREV
jgi:hypothetical protein